MVTLLFRSYAACILGLFDYFTTTKILRLRRICKLEAMFISFYNDFAIESLIGCFRFPNGIDDERAMETLINQSETFKHFINLDDFELRQVA